MDVFIKYPEVFWLNIKKQNTPYSVKRLLLKRRIDKGVNIRLIFKGKPKYCGKELTPCRLQVSSHILSSFVLNCLFSNFYLVVGLLFRRLDTKFGPV